MLAKFNALMAWALKGPLDALIEVFMSRTAKDTELDKDCKPEHMFSLDASGKLKIESKKTDVSADTSTEILLQFALRRRGLSMDQANLLEYNIHQKWVDRVIKMRLTPPPHGYQMTSFRQILDADKKLFEELCDATRAGVQVTAEGRPLDKCFVEICVATTSVQAS